MQLQCMSYLYRMFFCINVHSENIRVDGCISNTKFALPLYLLYSGIFIIKRKCQNLLLIGG